MSLTIAYISCFIQIPFLVFVRSNGKIKIVNDARVSRKIDHGIQREPKLGWNLRRSSRSTPLCVHHQTLDDRKIALAH
jgi:hypothetical protein